MKKLLLIFSICSLAVTSAFSQDDVYYTGDEATVEVKAQEAPPAMPNYIQPACPTEGYMWTPGYWAWAAAGYYWVPGVWVAPPQPGFLWTPGYWGFYHGFYGWHAGYWGLHVGYYGGVNYGYGYGGSGFYGGRWEGGAFRYNAAVWSVGAGFHSTYRESVSVNITSHASYNGPGGVAARPTPNEQVAMHENHVQATSIQQSHQVSASNDRNQFASVNHGKPTTAAMNTPNGQHFGQSGHAANPSSNHQMSNSNSHPSNSHPTSSNSHPGNNNTSHAQPSSHGTQQAHNNGNQRVSKPAQAKPQQRSAPRAAPHNSGRR